MPHEQTPCASSTLVASAVSQRAIVPRQHLHAAVVIMTDDRPLARVHTAEAFCVLQLHPCPRTFVPL
eukprot:353171-Chlamydomonas_euryale.AAC.9